MSHNDHAPLLGVANGIATLDGTGKVPAGQISGGSGSSVVPWTDSRFPKVPILAQTLGLPGRFKTATVPSSGSGSAGACFDGTYLWVTNYFSATVDKIDPRTSAIVATVAVGSGPLSCCFDGRYVWVTNSNVTSVSQIDTTTNTVANTVTVASNPFECCFDGTYVWVTMLSGNSVAQITASTHTVANTVALGGGTGPIGCCFDGTVVWVTCDSSNEIKAINPGTHAVVDTVALPGTDSGAWGVVYDGVYLWIGRHGGGTTGHSITQFNAATHVVVGSIETGAATSPERGCFDGTYVWFGLTQVAKAVQIHARSGAIVKTPTVGGNPKQPVFDGTYVWVPCVTSGDTRPLPAGPYSSGLTGSTIVHVSKDGNNLTGDGSPSAPFLTVSAALAAITDAAAAKVYVIDVGPGDFTDSFALKNFVFIRGAALGSSLRPSDDGVSADGGSPLVPLTQLSGTLTVNDPSWNAAATGVAGFDSVIFKGTETFDFSVLASEPTIANLVFRNCGSIGSTMTLRCGTGAGNIYFGFWGCEFQSLNATLNGGKLVFANCTLGDNCNVTVAITQINSNIAFYGGAILCNIDLGVTGHNLYATFAPSFMTPSAIGGGKAINAVGTGGTMTVFATGEAASRVVLTGGAVLSVIDQTLGRASVTGFQPAIVTKSANYLASLDDHTILVDASGGARTITLPAVSGSRKAEFVVKKIDSSANAVTVAPTGGDTIDGAANKSLAAQYNFQRYQAPDTGSDWAVVG